MTALQNIFIGLLRYLKDYCSDLQPTKFPIPFFASQTRDYFDFQRIGGIFNHLQQTEPVNLSDYDINNFNYDARFHGELFEYLLLLTHLGVGHKLRQVGDRVNIIREVDRENIKPNHVSTINVLPFSPLLPSIFFLLPCPSSPSLLPFPPLLPSLPPSFFSSPFFFSLLSPFLVPPPLPFFLFCLLPFPPLLPSLLSPFFSLALLFSSSSICYWILI